MVDFFEENQKAKEKETKNVIVINRDELPDKITWGKADFRKEFRFDSSNMEESKKRLENYLNVIREVEVSEVILDGKN